LIAKTREAETLVSQLIKLAVPVLLLALGGCESKPYRYCFSDTVEEDGGYFYEFDGGYFYEFDGGYFYEFDGGYFYEFDKDRGPKRHVVVCRSGVECSTTNNTACVPPP
jgi:hypothetical protein